MVVERANFDNMAVGVTSYNATRFSLPYRKPSERVLKRRNGTAELTVTTTADFIPYGIYPRKFEIWATTMMHTHDSCWDPDTRTLTMGTSFREFMRRIGSTLGGRQANEMRRQLEALWKTSFTIEDLADPDRTHIRNWVVSPSADVHWNDDRRLASSVELTEEYVTMLLQFPVPVDLDIVAALNSPVSIDVYMWASRRIYGMGRPLVLPWDSVRSQFSDESSQMFKFRQTFKRAVEEVKRYWPELDIECTSKSVTLRPSSLPVSSNRRLLDGDMAAFGNAVAQVPQRRDVKQADETMWFPVRVFGADAGVWWCHEAFNGASAMAHFDGAFMIDECPVCQFDKRNVALHGKYA